MPLHFHASGSPSLNVSAGADDPIPEHGPDLRLLPGVVWPLLIQCEPYRFAPEYEISLLQQISFFTTEISLWMAEC